MRLRPLVIAQLALMFSCASPRSEPPPELATPNLEAAPLPELEAPALPPVLPTPTPTAVGAFEMLLPVTEEVSAEELGLLTRAEGRLALTLDLAPCRFAAAEPETSTEPVSDCRAWNRVSAHDRTQRAIVVHPGTYEIVVRNEAFERGLGLWLRREDEPSLPVIAGGGANLDGEARWSVELTSGRYIYSCPLSPTPDYLLIVR